MGTRQIPALKFRAQPRHWSRFHPLAGGKSLASLAEQILCMQIEATPISGNIFEKGAWVCGNVICDEDGLINSVATQGTPFRECFLQDVIQSFNTGQMIKATVQSKYGTMEAQSGINYETLVHMHETECYI